MEKEISKSRKCPKCNEHKEGDKFYNHMSFYCIPCANEFSRDRRKKIADGELYVIKKVKNHKWFRYLDSKGVKYCFKCENVKPKNGFFNDKNRVISGKDPNCKKCIKKDYYRNIDQKKEDRYSTFLNSDWYKKYLERPTKKASPNSKAKMNERINIMMNQKKKKFLNLPKYQ
jgi:hypothetical protein